MSNPVIVSPEGEIDLATVAAFRATLAEALATEPDEVVVDLTNVTFIDSTGLGTIVDASHRCRRNGGRMAVVAPHGSAAAVVLQLTGLGSVLDIIEQR